MSMEDDEQLRARLRYVAVDVAVLRLLPNGDMLMREIALATGHQIDEVADRFGLRRRWL